MTEEGVRDGSGKGVRDGKEAGQRGGVRDGRRRCSVMGGGWFDGGGYPYHVGAVFVEGVALEVAV